MVTADDWDEGNDDKLFVFAGNAAGALDPPVMLPAPGTSQELGLALADLDGDGAKDAAVAAGGVLLLFYQRAGRLTEGRPLAAGGHAQLLEAADLDGDGDADLVASMRGSEAASGVMWYRNTPAGFERHKLAGGFPRDVAVGDVDGDGDLDVAAAHDSYLQILRQAAGHTFAEEQVAGATSEVELGDVTGDGRTDIVALNDRTVTVRAQTTAGGVGAQQVVDENPTRAVGLDLGDIDGDGRTDATAIHDGGFWAEIYLQQPGGGGLGAGEGRQVPQGNTRANGLAIGDANADGAADISYANNNYGLVVRRARSATFPLPAWVRDSAPDEGTRNVPGSVVPRLTLTRAVAPASVTTATVWLERAGTRVGAAPSYGAGILSVQPAATLAAGDYALRVSGVRDTRGNRLEHTLRFTVGPGGDAADPDTVLRSAPSGSVKSQSPRMWAYATEPGATLQCSLDSAPFAPCPDPIEHSSVLPGAHTFHVRAVDGAGRVDQTPATRSWLGDGQLTAPANDTRDAMTVLAAGGGRSPPTRPGDARRRLRPDRPRQSRRSVDLVPWTAPADGWATFDTADSSIDTLLGVFAGGCREEHRLAESDDAPGRLTSRVRLWVRSGTQYAIAVDGYSPEGVNAQNGPVTLAWSFQPEADVTPPETMIASGPGPVSWTTYLGWTFRASEPGSTSSASSRRRPSGSRARRRTALTLFVGTRTLSVRAVDPAGNADPTPASRTWHTDALAAGHDDRRGAAGDLSAAGRRSRSTPTSRPSSNAASTTAPGANAWSPASYCRPRRGHSPVRGQGHRRRRQRGSDPAVRAWVIDGGGGDLRPPQTDMTVAPPDVTTSASARFEFTSDEPEGGRFECRLDGGDWLPCTSPRVYDGLAPGEHSVMVRAIDAAGNVDPSRPSTCG